MNIEEQAQSSISWEAVPEAFSRWLNNRHKILEPGLFAEPTIKVLIFLALLETDKACSYEEIKQIIYQRNVVKGNIPDNTLRTSVLNLGKTLEKFSHPFELKSYRGHFQLVPRVNKILIQNKNNPDPVILLLEPGAIKADEIAQTLIEKAMLPFNALYFLEWSARWWENYSSKEAEIRLPYEASAWESLGVKDRLLKSGSKNDVMGLVGLGPGEGLAEIELIKKILNEEQNKQLHYVAIDSSPRLLRDHIGLLKETLTTEIESGRLLCAGIVADIFVELREALNRVKQEFVQREITKSLDSFLPSSCSLLVTYFGNCLGNNFQDQETELFSTIHSIFQNRPLELLVGVSIMRDAPDDYKRNWDDFLLQTPRHLLETKKFLRSSQLIDNYDLPEFMLPLENGHERCPPVVPEPYFARHQIEGQIYRFYYRLAFDLELAKNEIERKPRSLPKGTLILLYNIIKYKIDTLVNGIEKCGLFKIKYDKNYHQIVATPAGTREYVVFSAFLD